MKQMDIKPLTALEMTVLLPQMTRECHQAGGLSLYQAAVLFVLEARGKLAIGRVAREIGAFQSALVNPVDELEERGWIQRTATQDRRVRELSLVEARKPEIIEALTRFEKTMTSWLETGGPVEVTDEGSECVADNITADCIS